MQRVPDRSSRPGDTQARNEEKREVIGRLRDVLRSCCTLLEKTSQIPINGDVNLLQCILKCASPLAASRITCLAQSPRRQMSKVQSRASEACKAFPVPRLCALHARPMSNGQIRLCLTEHAARGAAAAAEAGSPEELMMKM